MRIGILASHGGSNAQAIIDACEKGTLDATVAVVISNNSSAMALERARAAGIDACHLSSATHPDPDVLDHTILDALRSRGVDLIALAGYMKKLGPQTLAAYRGRVLNIHPSLLPRHGGHGMYGTRVHEAVLTACDTESGATVHVVDGDYDTGPVLAQAHVPVLPDDSVESLATRVLAAEHALYVDTLHEIATGTLRIPLV